jgi:hypothetical protein
MMKYGIESEARKIRLLEPGPKRTAANRALRGLRIVLKECAARGLDVQWRTNVTSHYQWENKVIILNTRLLTQKKLHILLHELGHHLVGESASPSRWTWGYSSPVLSTAGNRHKLDILDEEFEAWSRGWDLGVALQAIGREDLPSWERTKYACLNEYIGWVANKSIKSFPGIF